MKMINTVNILYIITLKNAVPYTNTKASNNKIWLTKTAHSRDDSRSRLMNSSSFFSLEKLTSMAPRIKNTPTSVLVISIWITLKNFFSPKTSSLKMANTLVVNQPASKPLKLSMVPAMVAGIKINQPMILYLEGNNNCCFIINCFRKSKVNHT